MHSAAINVARGGKKEVLHVDAFVWVFRVSDGLFVSSSRQMHANMYNKTVRRFFFVICPASNYLTSFLRRGLSESVGVVGLNTVSKNEMEMTGEKLKMMEK